MITVQNLSKDYGRYRAVDQVSFSVNTGDVLGFLGPNGAGKSTTMKMVTGFLTPTSGTARLGEHDIRTAPVAAKRLLGYLPESGPLYPEMSVLEFLRFIGEVRGLRGADLTRAIDRVLEACFLGEVRHQIIETLSKGFRQRVGMAQAILHDPPILILDEPTDGLDPNQKREIRQLIASMGRQKAILVSTHILEEVTAMCNRVIIIDRGKVVVDETPAALAERHPNRRALRLEVAPDQRAQARADLASRPEIERVEDTADGAFLLHPRGSADLTAFVPAHAHARGWTVLRLERPAAPLDEVFRQLTAAVAS